MSWNLSIKLHLGHQVVGVVNWAHDFKPGAIWLYFSEFRAEINFYTGIVSFNCVGIN